MNKAHVTGIECTNSFNQAIRLGGPPPLSQKQISARVMEFVEERSRLHQKLSNAKTGTERMLIEREFKDLQRTYASIFKSNSQGKLSEADLKLLANAGVVFKNRDDGWHIAADKVITFINESGAVPRSRSDNHSETSLAIWLAKNKRLASAGKMNNQRIEKWEQIEILIESITK